MQQRSALDQVQHSDRRSFSIWTSLLRTNRRPQELRTGAYELVPATDSVASSTDSPSYRPHRRSTRSWKRIIATGTISILLIPLVSFGVLHIVIVLAGHTNLAAVDAKSQQRIPFDRYQAFGSANAESTGNLSRITQDVVPIPCHSHNDYQRKHPFFDAIRVGCTSTETDIWLTSDGTELYVGHNRRSLSKDRTLRSLYLNPILEILDSKRQADGTHTDGIFDMAPEEPLVLLLDFKTDGHDLWPHVQEHVKPLREKGYLSFWNGSSLISRAVTLVASGNAPYDLIAQETGHRDIFLDAPLDQMGMPPKGPRNTVDEPLARRKDIEGDDWDMSSSFYASTSFKKAIGWPWMGSLSTEQVELIRAQVRGAHERGLKARYWETPAWPISLRNHIWQILLQEGCDVLNVDDLYAAAFLDWNQVSHSWFNG